MKKLLVYLSAFLIAITACSNKEKLIKFDNLPKKAQTFITENFPDAECVSVIMDGDMLDKEYKVNLNEGTTIDFDKKGDWEEISNYKGVSDKFLPAAAVDYIKTNYIQDLIVKISFDPKELDAYEVKLINGVELKFNIDGQFLGKDM